MQIREAMYGCHPTLPLYNHPGVRYPGKMIDPSILEKIQEKFNILTGCFDERTRRLWAAVEANELGHGGVQALSRITGLARQTITDGLQEIASPDSAKKPLNDRVRRPGGGRKKITETRPEIIPALEDLLEPSVSGDPMGPLRWTCKSTRNISEELGKQGFQISHQTVKELLHKMEFSLQGNNKIVEGTVHPDRNEQFRFINEQTKVFQKAGQPAVSVDTKKKELIGNFKNPGKEWRETGHPRAVKDHDFEDKELGKAVPYGIYDVGANEGFVNVGIDHDTAEFAVNSIRVWWKQMGSVTYSKAKELLIMADCGGSNGYRTRLWKTELQKLANETGLRISVCHFPPGTSKWNKIEHSMFSFISLNWRGQPLETLETVVNLIGNTKTKSGLSIKTALDHQKYEKGLKITDEELENVQLEKNDFHGEWNYSIGPSKTMYQKDSK